MYCASPLAFWAVHLTRFIGLWFLVLYQRGKLPIDKLLSEIVSIDELNEAFDRLAEGKSIRQVMRI